MLSKEGKRSGGDDPYKECKGGGIQTTDPEITLYRGKNLVKGQREERKALGR